MVRHTLLCDIVDYNQKNMHNLLNYDYLQIYTIKDANIDMTYFLYLWEEIKSKSSRIICKIDFSSFSILFTIYTNLNKIYLK